MPPEDERRERPDAPHEPAGADAGQTLPGGWLPPKAARAPEPPAPPPSEPGQAPPPPVPPGDQPPQGPLPPPQPGAGQPGAQSEPPQSPPPAQPAWAPPAGQQPPPTGVVPAGQQPPAPGAVPPGYGPPPPGYGPPGYGPPPGWGAPAWQQPTGPGNAPAVTGFALSVAGLAMLLLTVGFSSVVSLGLSIAGTIVSRNGREKVDRGETTQHRGIAQAGFVIGIAGIVLSALATLGWLALALSVFDDIGGDDDPFDEDFRITRAVAAALALAVRLAG